MSGTRPVYVPNRQRRKQQQRFHGAFTGGFSAGYFNTVGSQEGWKPRQVEEEEDDGQVNEINGVPTLSSPQSRIRQLPQQRLEDFMDEHDHDTWGGPTSLKREYQDPAAANKTEADSGEIADWVQATTFIEPPANVGHRLLRILGWREGRGTAYVSESQQQQDTHSSDDAAQHLLSKKRLRRVQVQQERVKIPPPKLDACGLGFEPYGNAPEFQAYKERRRKAAQQRARLRGTTAGQTSNVYRVSNVIAAGKINDDKYEDEDNDNPHPANFPGPARQKHAAGRHDTTMEGEEDAYLSYETVEDFVGNKTVGGFALREDDDMAYDDGDEHHHGSFGKMGGGKVQVNKEHFNLEVYEHSSDEEDAAHFRQPTRFMGGSIGKGDDDFAGALSAFAGNDVNLNAGATDGDEKNGSGGVTADGKHPPTGFVLGGVTTGGKNGIQKRYPGPDVPLEFEVKSHEFGPDEHPLVLKALSRAVQLEAVDEKRRQAMEEALKANAAAISNTQSRQSTWHSDSTKRAEHQLGQQPRSSTPMAGGAFSGLAEAMKNRFTSVVEDPPPSSGAAGLRQPATASQKEAASVTSSDARDDANNQSQQSDRTIKMTRTIHTFAPHRLLCKRFHVPAPVGGSSASNFEAGRRREETFFQQEVLTAAAAKSAKMSAAEQDGSTPQKGKDQTTESTLNFVFGGDSGDIEQDEPTLEDDRPSMAIYKSIYEPESDLDDESELDDETTKEEANDRQPEQHGREGMKTSDEGHPESAQIHNETADDNASKEDLLAAGPPQSHAEVTAEVSLVPYKDRDRKRKKDSKGEKKRSKKKKHRKEKRSRRHVASDEEKESSGHASGVDGELADKERRRHHRKHRRKRSLSPSPSLSGSDSDSTDLSRESNSSDRKARRRDRKEAKRRKKEKKSKRSQS